VETNLIQYIEINLTVSVKYMKQTFSVLNPPQADSDKLILE